MTKTDFLNSLKENGFPEPVLVEQPANGFLDIHTHEFEVRALIIEGSIEINSSGKPSYYCVGQEFHLAIKEPHSEKYGETGVKYLASRKMF